MRYFYRDQDRREIGPYTMEELRQLHLNGVVHPDTEVVQEDLHTVIVFRDLWANSRANLCDLSPTSATASSETPPAIESFTRRARAAGEDLRVLIPHLLVPFEVLKDFRWFGNKTLIAIAGIGLLPLLIDALFTAQGDIKSAYWALAFYFSIWWGLLFYHLFPSPNIDLTNCFICFFGTGVISIGLLLPLYQIPPLGWFYSWTRSLSVIQQSFGYLLGVSFPEELCKMAILFLLIRKTGNLAPQSMLFYGLMAGLGFGIYEGVGYQMGRNVSASRGFLADYYLSNLMRLTSLPFLHAIWTGIAGYFVAFAWLYPRRKTGLVIVAIGLPGLLHAIYDIFAVRNKPFPALSIALLSVVTLYLYLAKTVDFEKLLAERLETASPSARVPEPEPR